MSNINEFKLLPNYFKKTGRIIIGIAIIAFILLIIFNVQQQKEFKGYLGDFVFNGFIVGMFIIAFSKEDVEDERVRDFRYRSMATAFLFGTVFTILNPLLDFIFRFEYKTLSAQYIIGVALGIYLINFSAIRHEKQDEP